jgi:di/tricarboxylate transporter
VSASGLAAHKTVRESGFRARYGAVVIAVARDGQRIVGKIGDIELEPGDTLLLEAEAGFSKRYSNSRDFLLVRSITASGPPRHERAGTACAILAGIVISAGFGWLNLLTASLVGVGLMLATRCVSSEAARQSIDLEVLVAIASAFGIGRAMETSGAGTQLGTIVVSAAGSNPMAALVAIYVATVLLTELITMNAAAALMFPIAVATAATLHVDVIPFAVAIMMAASASFATPVGCQTNLIVYGPGGYRFADFLRFGAPLNLLMAAITLIVIPRVWPLA